MSRTWLVDIVNTYMQIYIFSAAYHHLQYYSQAVLVGREYRIQYNVLKYMTARLVYAMTPGL